MRAARVSIGVAAAALILLSRAVPSPPNSNPAISSCSPRKCNAAFTTSTRIVKQGTAGGSRFGLPCCPRCGGLPRPIGAGGVGHSGRGDRGRGSGIDLYGDGEPLTAFAERFGWGWLAGCTLAAVIGLLLLQRRIDRDARALASLARETGDAE